MTPEPNPPSTAPPRLEYRAGTDDRRELGPFPTVDGTFIRFSFFLAGTAIGFLLAYLGIAILFQMLAGEREAMVVILSIVDAVALALIHQVGKHRERRWTHFVQGILGGCIAVATFGIIYSVYSLMLFP